MNLERITSTLTVLAWNLSTEINGKDRKSTQNRCLRDGASLSFAKDTPTGLTDGKMYGGIGTISKTAGNLQFYIKGLAVSNKNHSVMRNGTVLLSVYFIHNNGIHNAIIGMS